MVKECWSFPEVKFHTCPFSSICDAVHAPLLNMNHQHMTQEQRSRSEPKFIPVLLGCCVLPSCVGYGQ